MTRASQPDATSSSSPLPSGTVTFLFSDIEGSTQRWERDRAAMQDAVRRHDACLRGAIEAHDGRVFKTVGDAFCAAFELPHDAVGAALDAQLALSNEDFRSVDGLRVRMAIHTGNADERDGDYYGPALNRVARLLAIGNGGQVLVSGVASELVQGQMPQSATLHDLGAHRLKDLARPEQVYQLLAAGLPNDFPTLRSLDVLPNNLPLQLTSFVGREAEVAEVTALLGKHRIVTLIGAGGVGKTRVCLQVGANLLDGGGDGVWFVELAPIGDPELVPSTIAKAVEVVLPADGDPLERLVAALKGKHMLVIFDNCEHLVDSVAAAASAIVSSCPNVTILATSRQGLAIRGEATYRMPSLSLPGVAEAAELQAGGAMVFSAIALFVARCEAADPHFVFDDEIAPIVADICRRLDGIALAIELAAARVKVLKPKELRTRLDQRFHILTGGSRDTLPRQQTLRALIDWSYNLLDERERTLFRRVGIFVGGFALEGAIAVMDDEALDEFEIFDVLASLVDKSLVVAELSEETTRYRLLESTRAYAIEKLEAEGERSRMAGLHFAYLYEHFARAAASHESSPREITIAALAADLEDMRASLDWAVSNDLRRGAEFLTVTRLLVQLELHREGIERAHRFVAALENSDADLMARLWTYIAACEAGQYASKRSYTSAERAVAYARIGGNSVILADALLRFIRAAVFARRLDEAETALGEAEAMHGLSPRQHLDLLTDRSIYLSFAGDLLASTQTLEQIRSTHRSLGNVRGDYTATMNLAEYEHMLGHTHRAIDLARDALSIAQRSRYSGAAAAIRQNLAGYLVAVDERDAARAAGESVLNYYAKIDSANPHVPVALEHLALVFALEGAVERAARIEGYVEKCLRAVEYEREYTETLTQDRLMALLRERFSQSELDSLLAAGAAMSADEAIVQGLA